MEPLYEFYRPDYFVTRHKLLRTAVWWLLRTYHQHVINDVRQRDEFGKEWEFVFQSLRCIMSGPSSNAESPLLKDSFHDFSDDFALGEQLRRLKSISYLNLRVKQAATQPLRMDELHHLYTLFANLRTMYTLRCAMSRQIMPLATRSGFSTEKKFYRRNLLSVEIYTNAMYALVSKSDVHDCTFGAYPFDDT